MKEFLQKNFRSRESMGALKETADLGSQLNQATLAQLSQQQLASDQMQDPASESKQTKADPEGRTGYQKLDKSHDSNCGGGLQETEQDNPQDLPNLLSKMPQLIDISKLSHNSSYNSTQ